jgi:hypothetical protein
MYLKQLPTHITISRFETNRKMENVHKECSGRSFELGGDNSAGKVLHIFIPSHKKSDMVFG